jgi:dihydroflavonol-4-reductase
MNSSQKPSCLVLGATGFIGGHIARHALEKGYQVRGFRRNINSTGHLGDAPIEWHHGDLADFDSLLAAMQGVDVVFHAAAFYPTHSKPKEVPEQVAYAREEIERVIQAARQAKVGRFIYTSSLTTIGKVTVGKRRLADESDYYVPGTLSKSGYYETKIAMEAFVLDAAREGFPAVVVCPTAVFGPGDVHLSMGRILLAIKRGWVIAWVPVTTNVIDVRDVAKCQLVAAEKGRIGERYILGAYNTSVKTIIDRACFLFKVRPPRIEISIKTVQKFVNLIDLFPSLSTGNHMRAIPLWQSYNTEKAENELELRPIPFEETIKDSILWFRENGIKI